MKNKKNENTESLILDAAKRIFQAKGMDGARMQEIADEAGINKAMLHYYFRSKQMLFEAVFKNAFSLLAPQLNTVLNDDSSIEEKVKNFSSNYISFIVEHPYLPNFIIQELNKNPDFILKMKESNSFPNLEKFKKQVDDEVEKNRIRKISAEQLFINILALNIFPFVAKPLLQNLINVGDQEYQKIVEERKTAVANFIINSIKI
jgi:AcrR family transcriptional regulator